MDLFISYAHEDSEFVVRLRQALSARGREVWVDTEGIEPADRWRGSAQEAIERTDSFVFVLSPASLASAACLEELDHGVSLNKRVIAICVDEAAAELDKPAAIDELSWIMMRSQDDFERGIEQLTRALDVDLETVRQHTRILVRARAWELADRRSSPLLRGEELAAAEDWLSRASLAADPRPTELQREFIVASRRAATRRQRLIAGVSLAVAALAVALSVFALIQRSDAINNQKTAQSRQLAAEAEQNISSNDSLSTLLALKALSIRYTPQAGQALRDALASLQTLVVLRGDTDQIQTVAYNSEGTRLVTASSDGTARVWNVRTGAQLLKLTPGGGAVADAAFSPGGSRIVTADHDGKAKVWSATSGHLLETIRTGAGGLAAASFSPDGSRIVTAGADAQVWDADTGALQLTVKDQRLGIASAAFSPDGAQIATAGDDGSVRVWDARTGTERQLLTGKTYTVAQVSYSPNGAELALAGTPTRILDARTGRVLLTLSDQFGQQLLTATAGFSADGSRLVTAGGTTADVWDAHSGRQLNVLGTNSSGVSTAVFSPSGTRIATAEEDHTAAIWDADAGNQLLVVRDPSVILSSAAFSPNDEEFLTAAQTGAAHVWQATTGRLLLSIKTPPQLASAAFSPDGSRILTAGSEADVWDARSGRQLASFDAGYLGDAQYSPNGSRIVVAGSGASVWDGDGTRRLLTLERTNVESNSASYSRDGARIAVGNADGTTAVFNAGTGARLLTLRGDTGAIENAGFSPDGTKIVTASADGTARVWAAGTGAQLMTLVGHTGAVEDAVFSADGAWIATSGADGTVRIWDARTGAQLAVFTGDTMQDETVQFNASGSELLSSSQEGTARIWSTRLAGSLASLEALARGLVTRPLTAEERRIDLAGIT
jgi:WD40 repeat protein